MTTYETFAILSALIMVALELVLRALQRERDQGWFLSALGSWAGGLVLLPFIPYSTLDLSPLTIFLLIVAGSSWAISVIADVTSHATLPVGLGALLASLRTVLLVIIGALFFGDPFNGRDMLGTVLAIVGVLIACSRKSGGSLTGIGIRLVGVVASGMAIITEKALAQRTAIELVIAGGYIIPGILYLILKPNNWREQLERGSPRRTALIGLYTILYMMIGPFFVVAFAFGNLGETFVIFQSRLVLTTLLGAIILHERTGLAWKLFGMSVTLVGLYFVMR
jgi:drug/metabolite transporter (DMT)-like permease